MDQFFQNQRKVTKSLVYGVELWIRTVKGDKIMTDRYGYDTRLCIVMTISMLLGAILFIIARTIDAVLPLYIISLLASFSILYLLPEKISTKLNQKYLNGMRANVMVLLFVLWFGPIAFIFILVSVLSKQKKSEAEKHRGCS
ncbi:hypothetical protein KAU51_03765 [Candidatus Parcubacteria bacterium]|nr:hypothetical protein [Candidatus Parcubacteria bacterium]